MIKLCLVGDNDASGSRYLNTVPNDVSGNFNNLANYVTTINNTVGIGKTLNSLAFTPSEDLYKSFGDGTATDSPFTYGTPTFTGRGV